MITSAAGIIRAGVGLGAKRFRSGGGALPFMLDSFAGSGNLHGRTMDTGQVWTAAQTAPLYTGQITSGGRAIPTTPGQGGLTTTELGASRPTWEISVEMGASHQVRGYMVTQQSDFYSGHGIVFHFKDASRYSYFAYLNGSNWAYRPYYGANPGLYPVQNIPTATAVGDIFSVRKQDGVITFYRNGMLLDTAGTWGIYDATNSRCGLSFGGVGVYNAGDAWNYQVYCAHKNFKVQLT